MALTKHAAQAKQPTPERERDLLNRIAGVLPDLERYLPYIKERAAGLGAAVGDAAGGARKAAGGVLDVAFQAGERAGHWAWRCVESREFTADVSKWFIELRGKEQPAQILFRVPESLRFDVKRLSLDQNRKMDELLIEAVVDLLLKYERLPQLLADEENMPPRLIDHSTRTEIK